MDKLSDLMDDLARELKAGGDFTVVMGWGNELLEVRVRDDLLVEVERRSATDPIPYSLVKNPSRRSAAAMSARRSGTSL